MKFRVVNTETGERIDGIEIQNSFEEIVAAVLQHFGVDIEVYGPEEIKDAFTQKVSTDSSVNS